MAQNYSPKIVQDSLVMCLDASQNRSYPSTDLPVKAGLLLWLDAADDTTFSYSSGTEVSQWRDKSGNNFHANQATTAQQPSRSTVVNSRKSVNFTSGNSDFMRVNSGMVFTNSVTAIVFIKPGTQNNAYANVLDQDHGMDGYNGWVIQRNNTASQWLVWLANEANTTWLNTNAISYTDNTSQIVTLRKGSSTITSYSNGTSSGDVAVANQQIRQANYIGLNIGYWRAGAGRFYNGEICEIVVYNRALSLTELNQVHTYLGQKWGVSNTDRSVFDLAGNNTLLFGTGNVSYMPYFDFYNKGALKFDGSNDFAGVASTTTYGTNTTWEAWVNRTISANEFNMFMGAYLPYFGLRADGSVIFSNIINSVQQTLYSTGFTSSNDTWYYLSFTTNYNGTNTTARIYINGVLNNSATFTGAQSAANEYFGIGDGRGTSSWYPFNGKVSNVKVYNRTLSATEVAQNYEAQKSKFANTIVQSGLVLNLDAGNPYSYAGAGTTWYDVSGNSYNGTLIGSPSYTSNNNGGIIFDSNAKYGTLPTSGLAFGTGQFAIEVWVYSTAAVTNNVIYASQSSNVAGFVALFYPSGLGFALTDFNSVGVRTTTTHQTAVSQNTWYHVVGIRNASNQYIVYVNGVASTTNATATTSLTTAAPQIASNPATTGERFTGTIASLRLYNRSLSATEVLQNYNATKGRFGL